MALAAIHASHAFTAKALSQKSLFSGKTGNGKRSFVVRASAEASGTPANPQFTLQVTDKDGSVKTLTCKSGRIIRNVLKEEKIELYTTWGKLSNCGGAGNCGTCVVEVVEGADVLSAKTTAELKKLKGKPESWRLACQTNLGDGDNEGKVSIKVFPAGK